MNEQQVRLAIAESMRCGAASITRHARIVDADILVLAVRRAQAGSESAKADVVNGMSLLVLKIARTYMYKWASHLPVHASFDDIFGGGMVGLQMSVDRFDLESGNAFTSYAPWYIRSEIQRSIYDIAGGGAIRAKAFIKGVPASDSMVGTSVRSFQEDFGEEQQLGDCLGTAPLEDDLMDIELVAQVLDMMSAIDPKMRRIAKLLDTGYSIKEIAEMVGIPLSKVRQLRKQAEQALS